MTDRAFTVAGCGPHGQPFGENSRLAVHSDETYRRAWALRAEGWVYRWIGAELDVPRQTLKAWFSGQRRRPPSRTGIVPIND